MATLSLDNAFNSYELTPQEQEVGCILSSAQYYVIQNRLSVAAHAKINIAQNVSDPLASLRDVCYYDGQIDALRGILNEHDLALSASQKIVA